MVAKEGIMDKQGSRNLQHPHFQTASLRMMTRSKKARLETGGIKFVHTGFVDHFYDLWIQKLVGSFS